MPKKIKKVIKKKKSNLIATIIVHGLDKMSSKKSEQLVKWLRGKASFINRYRLNPGFAKKFTTRFFN